jgi:hypothetical protein
MGALTSKPFAFTARPWELKLVKSVDLTNGESVKIKLNVRGNEILRVLPLFTASLSSEWITDKARFNYDGLNRNRLRLVSLKMDGFDKIRKLNASRLMSLEGSKLDWSLAFELLAKMFDIKRDRLLTVLSSQTDLSTIVATKKLVNNLGSSNLVFQIDNGNNYKFINSVDQQRSRLRKLLFSAANFSKNSTNEMVYDIDNRIAKTDVYILLNTNIRFESPVIFSKILKQLNASGYRKKLILFNSRCPSVLIGAPGVINLGNNLVNFKKFIQGRTKFSSIIANSEAPLFLFGDINFNYYKDYLEELIVNFYNKFLIISGKVNALNPFLVLKNGANGSAFSVLFKANYSGNPFIRCNRTFNFNSAVDEKVVANGSNQQKYGLLLLGDFANPLQLINTILTTDQFKFVIHQKNFSNVSINLGNSVIQLPQLDATEARLTFINQFLVKQLTEISVNVTDKERKGWHIINALAEIWGVELGYQKETDLMAELEQWEPFASSKSILVNDNDSEDLFLFNKKIYGKFENMIGQNNGNGFGVLNSNTHDFFNSDTVSRNSAPMALAQKKREVADFNNFNYNY